MDCSQFREVLAGRWPRRAGEACSDRLGALPAGLRDQAFEHAENCGDCGPLLTDAEWLDAQLLRLAAEDGGAQASACVEEQLLIALRQRKAEGIRRRARLLAPVIGIAAMLVLSIGFWVYRDTSRSVGPALAQRQASRRTTHPWEPTEMRSTRVTSIPVRREATVSQVPTESTTAMAVKATNRDATPEVSSPFIPLPDADDPAALEDGAVVRVVMPRADLASFGLAVEAMEGDGTVRADLIVSADGTPQAIRVVSQDDSTGSPWR